MKEYTIKARDSKRSNITLRLTQSKNIQIKSSIIWYDLIEKTMMLTISPDEAKKMINYLTECIK